MLFAPLLCIAAYYTGFTGAAELSTVELDYGTFEGETDTDIGLIYFRGIRYADPPLGPLRWQAPVSPPSLNLGEVDATEFGFACIAATQKGSGPTTSEDCLFGNVYIPIDTTAASGLPVLVYFHGGGFESGRSIKYPPEDIILASAEPLVFATFEYRLGPFGFLAGTPVHDNGMLNAGLLDQKAALEWVQRYIGQFGGDPARVTIWGQSAGAGSVVYHLIANGGNNVGLFNQAIADSPPLLSLHDYSDSLVENLFTKFTRLAGCGGKVTGALTMSCLRAASTNTLATAGSKTLPALPLSLYPFGPVADGSFIQQRPVDALIKGSFARVPVLFGSNSDEGANWSAKLVTAANTSSPNATQITVYNFLVGQYPTLTNESFQTAITQYYPLADYGGSFSLQGQQMYGEMRYICTAVLVARAARAFGVNATYQYHWDNPTLGSTHADELVMFFNPQASFDPEDDPADEALALAMRQYWTSFATSGVPMASGSDAVNWPAGDDSNGSPRIFLHPGAVAVEEVSDELDQRCAFWHSLAAELDT